MELNPWLGDRLDFIRYQVTGQGGKLEVISADAPGSYGFKPDLIVFDEIVQCDNRELWDALFSAVPKRPHCVIVVITNAGFTDTWQHELREMAREERSWWLHEPRTIAGWIDKDEVDQQKKMLPPEVFMRLWRNKWSSSRGDFLTEAEIAACRDPELECREKGQRKINYVCAIDYGEKVDRTVATIGHRVEDTIYVDRQDVWIPKKGKPVLVETVEEYMREMHKAFNKPLFVLDASQMAGTDQRMTRRDRDWET